MTTLQILNVLLLTAAAANGQSYHIGRCPNPTLQENFNITEYMGTWYELQKFPTVFEKGRCIQATYSLLPDGTVRVHNEELLSDGTINSIVGVAKVTDPSKPAILSVGFFKGLPKSPYKVLSTDYRSYALVYSCSNIFGLFHIDFAWILARSRMVSEDKISQLRGKMAAAGVDVDRLTVTNQTACEGYGWQGSAVNI